MREEAGGRWNEMRAGYGVVRVSEGKSVVWLGGVCVAPFSGLVQRGTKISRNTWLKYGTSAELVDLFFQAAQLYDEWQIYGKFLKRDGARNSAIFRDTEKEKKDKLPVIPPVASSD